MGTKIGFVLSGAGARIAQELALMKSLVQGGAFHAARSQPIVPQVISGTSSGAINAIALNAILSADGLVRGKAGNAAFGWHDYEIMISSIENKHIYEGGRIILDALSIVREGSILNTRPLRRLLQAFVEKGMGYKLLGDLPLKTYISVVERESGRVHRLCSTAHKELRIVDVLMASTAVPVIFPPQQLVLPESNAPVSCLDGGVGIDGVPVEPMKDEKCSTLYVIRPMKYDPAKPWNKPPPFARFQIMANALRTVEFLKEALFDAALSRAAMYAKSKAYCYMPELDSNYNQMDFECGDDQIRKTGEWAKKPWNRPTRV